MIYLIAGLIIGWLVAVYALAKSAGAADEAAARMASAEDDGRRAA